MTSNPDLFWGLIASMWIGNLMLVVLNLPMIGLWIKLLSIPYKWLFPAIVLFCAIGVYSENNNTFEIWMVAVFGIGGYVFHKLGCEPAPLLLGLILGPMMEENLRRALLLSRGDWNLLVTRPLSASLLAVAAVLLVIVLLPAVSKKREEAFVEDCRYCPGALHIVARAWTSTSVSCSELPASSAGSTPWVGCIPAERNDWQPRVQVRAPTPAIPITGSGRRDVLLEHAFTAERCFEDFRLFGTDRKARVDGFFYETNIFALWGGKGSEAANNTGTQTPYICLLTLDISPLPRWRGYWMS